jgi:hypothetical protein
MKAGHQYGELVKLAKRLGVSRQRAWAIREQAAGRCKQCGQHRPPELKLFCRACADKWQQYQKFGPHENPAD